MKSEKNISHMKCPFMKHRELLEFLTYLPWSLRNKLLKKVESKSDTLYNYYIETM